MEELKISQNKDKNKEISDNNNFKIKFDHNFESLRPA